MASRGGDGKGKGKGAADQSAKRMRIAGGLTTSPQRNFLGRSCCQLSFVRLLSLIGILTVAGMTLPSFQSGNDKVTLAAPLPAAPGTRTGP